MRTFFKWLGFTGIALVGVLLLAISWVYYASHSELQRVFEVPTTSALAIPSDPADIAEGKRLARLTGCMHCHRDDLGGQLVHDFPKVARFVSGWPR